ncbi:MULTISPECIES: LLM class flavin-dependent oxidoreductase [unclassified Rhizobium]|uniref:LLM class flavin-dependent oxidoreductase n=1 Tax=unclassified Rhizobium TaxID=2613769 RepID=UPI000BA8A10C|nr:MULTISPECIES: LLM class flavin-dependent oxidoreductase [unclassified Rhizobium]ASW07522.1 alkane 1-monooxygenase [Rhizobium sp. 11515TR]MDK4711337.1 LLM class flavin-dependent oxidoreductase [Rhizobium sp. CNPSo 4039]
MVPFSILDLSPVAEGSTISQSFESSKRMAQKAEELGYNRFWLAEHHGMPGVASAATSVVIGHVGAATSRIRIGSGGVMLPNHSPLVIAEQFGTLEALFPGRVDLGLGRAPGTDMRTAQALRRNMEAGAQSFPNDIVELQHLFSPADEGQIILAVPGHGANVPIWLLGSSLYSAHLAGMLGLPYAFASHFAPEALMDAIAIYRERFTPSATLDKPYVMVGAMGAVADTDEEAQYHFTSAQQQFVNLRRNVRGPFPRPRSDMDDFWTPMEKLNVENTLRYAIVGSPETAEKKISQFIQDTEADEVIISMPIHDIEARLKSVELFATLPSFQKVS